MSDALTAAPSPAGVCSSFDTDVFGGFPPEWSDLGCHAQMYAYAGIKIFPLHGIIDGPNGLRCACHAGYSCNSPGKHPLFRPAHNKEWVLANGKCYGKCGQLGHGLYDATNDVDTVIRWWRDNPTANIGKPAHGSGVAVLDVDPKHNGDESFERLHAFVLDRAGVDLMDTLVANTGRHDGRRGMHLEFAAPENGITSRAREPFGVDMPGLDTRGVGGYTVVWPSLHISGVEYEYLDWTVEPAPWPQVLTDLMTATTVTAAVPPVFPTRERGTSPKYGETALDKELDVLRGTGEGGRNDQLNTCAYNLGQLVGAGVLTESVVRDELVSAALSIGLGMVESLKTVESGLRNGMAKPRNLVRAA